MKNKTVAAWLAFLGGPLGLHRFYLHGLGDRIALAHQIAFGVERYGPRREDHGPAAAHGDVRVAGRRGERVDVVELDRHG